MSNDRLWWGEHSIPMGERWAWSIGDRAIVLQRSDTEWNSWNIEAEEPAIIDSIAVGSYQSEFDADHQAPERCLFNQTQGSVFIEPALADRPVVTRPATTLRIMPGHSARLFVSTPLWLRALTAQNGECFLDLPFWRPTDSWFGPSTIEGRLCYSKHTDARVSVDLLDFRPNRAITPVNITNESDEPLLVDRFSVPVPLLSLFVNEHGYLWTEAISIRRGESEESADLVLEKEAPTEAGGAQRLTKPREASSKRHLIRAIGELFG